MYKMEICSYGSANGVDGFCNIVNVLELPQVYGLEHVNILNSELGTGLVKPVNMNTQNTLILNKTL